MLLIKEARFKKIVQNVEPDVMLLPGEPRFNMRKDSNAQNAAINSITSITIDK